MMWMVQAFHPKPNQNDGFGEVRKVKHDLLLGILVGTILGLVFTSTLSAHLPFIVIITVLLMAKVISLK